jgi:hypothetical protein
VTRPLLVLVLIVLAACASGRGPGTAPDTPGVLTPADFPEEVTNLLTAAEADSCGVCIREKRADAFALADEWFAPGTRVQSVTDQRWHLLEGGEQELYFGLADAGSPTLSFRFHTEDVHLIGIEPEYYTDPRLAKLILERSLEEPGAESLEVIPFAYGEGASFLFDEDQNRLQVQCRILPASPRPTPDETP